MLKFKGDFKKLIPMGFKFHKLYARNYKVYEKNNVWIWVAHGGYIEVRDFFSKSKYIVKAILDGTYPVYAKDANHSFLSFKKGDPMGCMINKETGEIMPYILFIRKYGTEYYNELGETWKECHINKDTYNTILEIKEMIDIP